MINTIIEEYSKWLSRYIESENCLHKSQATLLATQLKSVQTMDSFFEVLSKAQEPQPHNPTNLAFFMATSDPFVIKLNATIQRLLQLQQIDTKTICLSFDKITTDKQTEALIGLLKVVLNDPRALLHRKADSLLLMIQDINVLQDIVKHLAQQDQKPRPSIPREGSFETVKPLNAQHDACLGLLRNNSGSFSDKNPNSGAANHLLQALLIIYQEINSVDPIPEDSWCALL